jgi:hypothetical protein
MTTNIPVPNPAISSPFNLLNYTTDDSTLTFSNGDLRYVRLTGSVSSGIQTFSQGASTTKILADSNTAAAPAYSFTGDTNTGMYRIGADNFGISTAGTLRFDISTSAITSTLQIVAPTIKLTTAPTSGYFLTSDASGVGSWASVRPTYTNITAFDASSSLGTLSGVNITCFKNGTQLIIAGRFVSSSQADLSSGYAEIDIPTRFSVNALTVEGVVQPIKTAVFNIATYCSVASSKLRINIDNSSGGTLTSYNYNFNVIVYTS